MKHLFVTLAVLLCVAAGSSASAQTVSGTATWTPNPVSNNVVQYTLQLNALTPVVVLPAACTATTCTQAIAAIPFGSNTVTLIAQNTGLNGALQSSPPTVLTFSLNAVPIAVLGLKITVP